MNDEKRKKILIIAIILFVVMGILFLVMRLSDKQVVVEPNIQDSIEGQPVFEPKSTDLEYDEAEIVEIEASVNNLEFTVLNLAKSYASRLGSWSTDNKGKNLQELLGLSTASMKKYLNERDLGVADAAYFGVTTKSLSAELLSVYDDKAEVLVGTQRIETDKELVENIFYQDIKLSLVKYDDIWLVNKAYWQD